MRAIRRFLGTDDEQGFILVHAAMVAKTHLLVGAQMAGVRAAAADDLDALTEALKTHAAVLADIVDVFGKMWSVSDPRAYLKFRTFIMGKYLSSLRSPLPPHSSRKAGHATCLCQFPIGLYADQKRSSTSRYHRSCFLFLLQDK